MQMADVLLAKPKGSNESLLYRLAGKGIFTKSDADWFLSIIK